jgi:hypothetical protein
LRGRFGQVTVLLGLLRARLGFLAVALGLLLQTFGFLQRVGGALAHGFGVVTHAFDLEFDAQALFQQVADVLQVLGGGVVLAPGAAAFPLGLLGALSAMVLGALDLLQVGLSLLMPLGDLLLQFLRLAGQGLRGLLGGQGLLLRDGGLVVGGLGQACRLVSQLCGFLGTRFAGVGGGLVGLCAGLRLGAMAGCGVRGCCLALGLLGGTHCMLFGALGRGIGGARLGGGFVRHALCLARGLRGGARLG